MEDIVGNGQDNNVVSLNWLSIYDKFYNFQENSNDETWIGYWNTDLQSQEFESAISNTTKHKNHASSTDYETLKECFNKANAA